MNKITKTISMILFILYLISLFFSLYGFYILIDPYIKLWIGVYINYFIYGGVVFTLLIRFIVFFYNLKNKKEIINEINE